MRSARYIKITTYALVAAFALFATSTAWAQQDTVQSDDQTVTTQPAQPAPQQTQTAPVQQNVYPPQPQPVYQAPPQPPPSQNNQVVVQPAEPAPPPPPAGTVVSSREVIVKEKAEYRNAFLFDPGALIGGVVDLEYEAALARWLGLALGLSINTYNGAFAPKAEGSFVAFGPEIGLRAHFIQDAPGGLWIGPELAVKYIAWRGNNAGSTKAVGTADVAYDLGAAVGYNFTIDHFLLSLGVGGGFGDYGYGVQWQPRFRLGVGAVF